MFKQVILIVSILLSTAIAAQKENATAVFWNSLQKHCGKSYEGTLVEAPANDDFRGKKLVMHVRACDSNRIRIPFFVGDDKSRTWVLTKKIDRILLKHDHRHSDGKPDSITMYGGYTSSTGLPGIQVFTADQETANLIPAAASNVWWITLDDTSFTYNLRRIGTPRVFTVKFDLTKPIDTPEAPWGWKD
jgi:hypothetical protein